MISLIFCGDLRFCPYVKRYTERLDLANCPYEVLFWNRSGAKLDLPSNYYWFDTPSEEAKSKFSKLFDFFKFRKWIKRHLKDHTCDGIVVLSTLPGVLLFDILKKYKAKYIFDIRDYSYEHISIFKKIEKKVISDSYFTSISSKGFQAFLPEYDYVIAHNFNRFEIVEGAKFEKQNYPLKLVWNGTVRYFAHQKQYLDALKNDYRFELIYHGTGTDLEIYKKYCEDNGITNVAFTGAYDNSQKQPLLVGAALLNNSYGDEKQNEIQYALSNRYYDGLIYHIPQLIETGSFKANLVESNGVGIALDVDASFADNLARYYDTIDKVSFDDACSKELNSVILEDDLYIQKIDDFIKMFQM